MLAIPRPTTREQCLEEARPCPWVGCRHHLLLEVAVSQGKPTKLVLNRPSRQHTGRRRGLWSSAAEALVQVWIDDAVELLARMEHSCSLDVVDAQPSPSREHEKAALHTGIANKRTGALLGVTKEAIGQTSARGLVRLRIGLKAYREVQLDARDLVREALRE